MFKIRRADNEDDVRRVRKLFEEYAASLGFDLGFQEFELELGSLPGDYGPPAGCILIAELGADSGGKLAGCVALRRFDQGICEMKRLYVVPEFRGTGLGRKLAEGIIREAKRLGYDTMRLDTLKSMTEANALYATLGFQRIAPYRHNPLEGADFFELNLQEYED